MARTIAEIKQEMTDTFMAESAVRARYGLGQGATFENSFSKVSIESLLFYVMAFGVWVMEKLMDDHTEAVEAALADKTPHTTRWYRNLVLGFCPGWLEEPPVKYCSIDDRGCRLRVKIAGGTAGNRAPVSSEVKAALEAYLAEEKDAGMKIEIVNENRNRLKATLRVWYDPMELRATEKPVEGAVKAYVSNLDFDGLLSVNGLTDAVRAVAGVREVKVETLLTKYATNDWKSFGTQRRAESGYWTIADGDLTVSYELYRKENL